MGGFGKGFVAVVYTTGLCGEQKDDEEEGQEEGIGGFQSRRLK
jgi:hypothetical protein